MSEIRVDVDIENPAAIFRESEGTAELDMEELAALPGDGGRVMLESIRDYVKAHPKLEALFFRREGVGTSLVIVWRWRR